MQQRNCAKGGGYLFVTPFILSRGRSGEVFWRQTNKKTTECSFSVVARERMSAHLSGLAIRRRIPYGGLGRVARERL